MGNDPAFVPPEWIVYHCEKCGHTTFHKPPYPPFGSPSNAYAETIRRIESGGPARPRDEGTQPRTAHEWGYKAPTEDE